MPLNEHGQPVGPLLPDYHPATHPYHTAHTLTGQYCRLELIDGQKHGRQLFEAFRDAPPTHWTYTRYGPFMTYDDMQQFIAQYEHVDAASDVFLYAVVVNDCAVGFNGYLRINTINSTIEIGPVCYAPSIVQTPVTTEANYLLLQHAFTVMHYRRVEWKCHSLNRRSFTAATRLGYVFEGTWKYAEVVKGRSRDSHWLSVTDDEYGGGVQQELQRWLQSSNFDASGLQLTKLNGQAANKRPHRLAAPHFDTS